MDLRMPGTDGVAGTLRITRELPDVRVLVLTTYDTDGDILRVIEAGATGYLLEATVKTHLLRTFTKLGVNDRTAAIATAVSRGLLAPPWQ